MVTKADHSCFTVRTKRFVTVRQLSLLQSDAHRAARVTPDMGATEDLDVTHCASLKTWNSFEAFPSTMIALISRRHSLTKECRSTSGTRTTGTELDTTIATCEEAIQIPFFFARVVRLVAPPRC